MPRADKRSAEEDADEESLPKRRLRNRGTKQKQEPISSEEDELEEDSGRLESQKALGSALSFSKISKTKDVWGDESKEMINKDINQLQELVNEVGRQRQASFCHYTSKLDSLKTTILNSSSSNSYERNEKNLSSILKDLTSLSNICTSTATSFNNTLTEISGLSTPSIHDDESELKRVIRAGRASTWRNIARVFVSESQTDVFMEEYDVPKPHHTSSNSPSHIHRRGEKRQVVHNGKLMYVVNQNGGSQDEGGGDGDEEGEEGIRTEDMKTWLDHINMHTRRDEEGTIPARNEKSGVKASKYAVDTAVNTVVNSEENDKVGIIEPCVWGLIKDIGAGVKRMVRQIPFAEVDEDGDGIGEEVRYRY